MMTISNENKVRVDALIDKQLTQCFNLITEAITILHDTGDTESSDLDNAISHLRCAHDMLALYRGRK
jgi:hypothetical protein